MHPPEKRKGVRLVVVDSVAFHCRAGDDSTKSSDGTKPTSSSNSQGDWLDRMRTLAMQAQDLSDLAQQQNLAVLAINQMTTKLASASAGSNNNNGSTFSQVPALGDGWAHAVTTRIGLSVPNGGGALGGGTTYNSDENRRRTLHLVKSPRLPSGTADFCIVQDGIRGMEYVDPSSIAQNDSKQQRPLPPSTSYTSHDVNKRTRTG